MSSYLDDDGVTDCRRESNDLTHLPVEDVLQPELDASGFGDDDGDGLLRHVAFGGQRASPWNTVTGA